MIENYAYKYTYENSMHALMEVIIDTIKDFYSNVDNIRLEAISSLYETIPSGGYGGRDTMDTMICNNDARERILDYFASKGHDVKIVKARYRYSTDDDIYMSYVHCDTNAKGWHVIIYLTPNGPEDGLTLFEHVEYGKSSDNHDKNEFFYRAIIRDTENMARFKPWYTEKYVYNQAVIVDLAYFHAPMNRKAGFGNNICNGRLLHIIEVHKV